MRTWIAFLSILKKDIKTYYLKPPNISWGIIFPLSWTLMQFLQANGTLDFIELLPGLVGMSILFGTTSMLAVTITFERKGRSFDRLITAPISLNTMVLAKISGTIVFGIFNAVLPIVFAAFVTDLSGVKWWLVVVGVLLTAIISTLLGLLIAVSAKEVFEAQTYSNFFRFPMLFLSGLFLPIVKLPIYIRWISYALPITYGADLLSIAIRDSGAFNAWLSMGTMLLFIAVLFLACRQQIKRKWIL